MKLLVFQMVFFLWLFAAGCTQPPTNLTENEIVATESVSSSENNNQTAVKFHAV
jgi:starvation-inducible outer membrane lipoprotein